jgi:hypothetical protein
MDFLRHQVREGRRLVNEPVTESPQPNDPLVERPGPTEQSKLR